MIVLALQLQVVVPDMFILVEVLAIPLTRVSDVNCWESDVCVSPVISFGATWNRLVLR